MQAFTGNGYLMMGDVGHGEASEKAVAIGAGGVVGAQPLLLGRVVEPRDQHRVPRRLAEVPGGTQTAQLPPKTGEQLRCICTRGWEEFG